MEQEYKSAATSINAKKLPAIYNRVNWERLYENRAFHNVLDIGAGKYVSHISEFLKQKGFYYFPYDPNNLSSAFNTKAMLIKPDVVICSNVLNVIKEKEIILNIHKQIRDYKVPFFITVYVGNGSGVGCPTQHGQSYQRNELVENYLFRWDEVIYKQTITLSAYKMYLQK